MLLLKIVFCTFLVFLLALLFFVSVHRLHGYKIGRNLAMRKETVQKGAVMKKLLIYFLKMHINERFILETKNGYLGRYLGCIKRSVDFLSQYCF